MNNRSMYLVILCIVSFIASVRLSAEWEKDGIPVCTALSIQYYPVIVTDSTGGAIVVWDDNRGAAQDIYGQRISPEGDLLWSPGGVPVCQEEGSQLAPEAVSDGEGGAIVFWLESKAPGTNNIDIYAQRIDSLGNPLWSEGGVAVCTDTFRQLYIEAIADLHGGAIVVWRDERNGPEDLYAQRLDRNGTILWQENGVAVCTKEDRQIWHTLVTDSAGGVFVAWCDFSDDYNLNAQRIDSVGSARWGADGIVICGAAGSQTYPVGCPGGTGDAIFAWEDWRAGVDHYIYAQRLDSSGASLWTNDGIPLCVSPDGQYAPE
ncbi:MAG: hypothetical protein JSU64_03580, partial [candidate division WOR-3 bacterium]